jgi:hypothetical protein
LLLCSPAPWFLNKNGRRLEKKLLSELQMIAFAYTWLSGYSCWVWRVLDSKSLLMITKLWSQHCPNSLLLPRKGLL